MSPLSRVRSLLWLPHLVACSLVTDAPDVPVATLHLKHDMHRGKIEFVCTVADRESRPIKLGFFFMRVGGQVPTPATVISSGTSGSWRASAPGGAAHTFTWDTVADLGHERVNAVHLLVEVSTGDLAGIGDAAGPLTIDNTYLPETGTCTDKTQNSNETDADCGGRCGASCQPGQRCATNSDCRSGMCSALTCLPGCVSHWRFDEKAGFTAHDSAGGHDGKLLGQPRWRPNDGVFGSGALELDGIDDRLEVAHHTELDVDQTPFTISVWVRLAGARLQPILIKGTCAGYVLVIREDGRIGFYINDATCNDEDYAVGDSQAMVNSGSWHHIAVRFSYGGTVEFFLDGRRHLKAHDRSSITGPIKNNAPLVIGHRWAKENLAGLLDDLRFYNVALSDGQIGQIQAGELPCSQFTSHK